MVFHIKTLSTYASQIVQKQPSGSVHSVYRNTVNIMIDGHLLAIQTANSPLSPISLITNLDANQFQELGLKNGDLVHLDCSGAKIANLSPLGLISHDTRHNLFQKFTHIINNSEVNGFNRIFQLSPAVDQDLILIAAEVKIHEADTLYRKGNYAAASEKLCELIGLGSGLTPSGDDFLCGILAGLHLQGKESNVFANQLRCDIQKNLSRTNEISKAFLKCALIGQFSRAVNELWNNPDMEQISQMFHAVGHSSGMDTLCGIYFLFFLME